MANTPEQARAYYIQNRERIRERQREYDALHRDQISAKARERYLRNREKILEQQRAYRQRRDPEQERAYQREWYVQNRTAKRAKDSSPPSLARRRAQYADNPEKVLERNLGWRARNRESLRTAARASGLRARHGMWPEDWAAMWAAQEGKCYLCGGELIADKAVIDHDHSCCPAGKSCPICRRGLAHPDCNVLIGVVRDDVILLHRIADALEAAHRAVEQRKAYADEQIPLFETAKGG